MITTAGVKAAYDALDAVGTAYWLDELTVDASGNLEAPTGQTYYVLDLPDDPVFDDLDGEAYSEANLTVQAWDTRRGSEWAARDAADTALTAIGWERVRSGKLLGDGTRYGVTSTYRKWF